MTKILTLSDDGLATGFGRIAAVVNSKLAARGYEIFAASLTWDGLLTATYDGKPLPYHVASLFGKSWPDTMIQLVSVIQPDAIFVTQDAPYCETVRNLPLDWSKLAFIMTTPVDGVPLFPSWVETAQKADGVMTISEFGVNAFREAGVQVALCRPGIEPDKFYRLPDDKRAELRQKMGIAPDAYVHGMMSQHQGRKAIPPTIIAFMEFAKDKPTARLFLDMDDVSPMGWHLPAACQQYGWDASKIIYRKDAVTRGIDGLNERYNLLDSHSVLAFREGFGLPVLESMATGCVSIAQDYCAGTEVLRDGRGILIEPIKVEGEEYLHVSTWGNAADKLPNYRDFTRKLQWLFDHKEERLAMGKRGMEWARTQNWDKSTDAAVATIEKALARKREQIANLPPPLISAPVVETVTPVIETAMQLVEATSE